MRRASLAGLLLFLAAALAEGCHGSSRGSPAVAPPTASTTAGMAGFLGVSMWASAGGTGAVIVAVQPGTPAEAVGLKPGDVIIAVNAIPVTDLQSFTAALQGHHPGERITLTWTSGGADHTGTGTLAAAPLVTTVPTTFNPAQAAIEIQFVDAVITGARAKAMATLSSNPAIADLQVAIGPVVSAVRQLDVQLTNTPWPPAATSDAQALITSEDTCVAVLTTVSTQNASTLPGWIASLKTAQQQERSAQNPLRHDLGLAPLPDS